MRTSFCTLLLLLRLSAFSATLPIGLLVFLPAPSCLHGMSTLQVGVTRVTIRFWVMQGMHPTVIPFATVSLYGVAC